MQHSPCCDYCVLVFRSIKIFLNFLLGWLLAGIHFWLSNLCFQPGYILIPDVYFCRVAIFTLSPDLSNATVLNANPWCLSSIIFLFARSISKWMCQDSCPGQKPGSYSRLSVPYLSILHPSSSSPDSVNLTSHLVNLLNLLHSHSPSPILPS